MVATLACSMGVAEPLFLAKRRGDLRCSAALARIALFRGVRCPAADADAEAAAAAAAEGAAAADAAAAGTAAGAVFATCNAIGNE